MNAGELFINIGIKGADKVKGGLKDTKGGMDEVYSSSLAVKAALLSVFYTLEQIAEAAGQVGASLSQFGAQTGLSPEELQKWQFAGRQVGVSFQDTETSIRGVQKAMSDLNNYNQAPEGLSLLQGKLAEIGVTLDTTKDTPFEIEKKMQMVRGLIDKPLFQRMSASFGNTAGFTGGLQMNAYRDDVFSRAPAYSEKEAKNLMTIRAQWENLGQKIQMYVGRLNEKHGSQLIQELTDLTTQALRLADAFLKINENLKLFKVIGAVFDGWAKVFSYLADKGNIIGKDGLWAGVKSADQDMMYAQLGTLNDDDMKKIIAGHKESRAQQQVNNDLEQTIIFNNNDGKEAPHHVYNLSKSLVNAMKSMPGAYIDGGSQ